MLISVSPKIAINSTDIVFIALPKGEPMSALIRSKREKNEWLSVTEGKKTLSIILLRNGMLIGTPTRKETLVERVNECGKEL